MKESILKKILLIGVLVFTLMISYINDSSASTNFTTSINDPNYEKILKLVEDKYLPEYQVLENKNYRHKVAKSIYLASKKYNIRYDLIAAIISEESSFKIPDKHLRNKGLMQVSPNHWEYVKNYDLKSVHGSIMAGTYVLQETDVLCNGDLECTIKSYNSGFYKYSRSKKKKSVSKIYYKNVKSKLSK